MNNNKNNEEFTSSEEDIISKFNESAIIPFFQKQLKIIV